MSPQSESFEFKREGKPTGSYEKSVLDSLRLTYRSYMGRIVLTGLCGFLGRALLLANTNLIGLWVDSLCPRFHSQAQQNQSGNICPVPHGLTAGWSSHDFAIALFTFVAVGFLLTLFFRVWFSRLSARAVSQLYDETMFRTSRFPMSFFDQVPVGRVVTRFSSDYGNVFRLFGGPLAEFLSILFDMICMIILASVASPYFLPVIVIFGFLHAQIYKHNREILRSHRRELSASRSPSIAHFSETAQGATTIRTFNRETSFTHRFNQLDQFYLTQRWKTVRAVLFFSWQNNILTGLLLLLTGVFSWYLLHKHLVSIGSIGVAFAFITLSGNTVLMFFEWLAQVEEALIGVERMNSFLRHGIEPGAELPAIAQFDTGHPIAVPHRKDPTVGILEKTCVSVEFRNISFRYGSNLPWVLQNFDLSIQPGEKVGLIGRTGSGKSTLTQILLHLYPIEHGEIRLDGVPADLSLASTAAGRLPLKGQTVQIPLTTYRRAFSYISQDPVLFRGTLRENLDFEGRHNESKMVEVLETVGLEPWATPQSLAMRIEEKGRNVSFGEKQLICLARALLQNAPIIIMDEATSAVDPQSEEILVQATNRFFQGRTQILIAHRLSTLQSCDRVVWLRQGKVVAQGPPSQILSEFERTDLSLTNSMIEEKHALGKFGQ